MSFLDRFRKRPPATPTSAQPRTLPTVKFDQAQVTDAIAAALRADIESLDDLEPNQIEPLYEAALRSVKTGRDMYSLSTYLMNTGIEGMTAKRSASICNFLHSRAAGRIRMQNYLAVGITLAKWRYSGTPCVPDPRNQSDEDKLQDEAHSTADNKVFPVTDGLFVGGKFTWPGRGSGCRCYATPVIPGISE